MPYTIRKVRNMPCYTVKNSKTGEVHAKCSSKVNAQRQLRLLNALDHGWKPKKRSTRSKRSKRSTRK